MSSRRVFLLMCVAVGLLGVANIGAVYAGNLILQSKSRKLSGLKLDSRVLDEQQSAVSKAKKDIETYASLEQIAKSIVPEDKDQAAAVREIVKIATDNGIKLASITFPASTLGQIVPKAAVEKDSTAPKVVTPPVTQVQIVDGIPGVYALQITVQQDSANPVSYDKFIGFLGALEQNRRTSQVSNITVQPNATDRSKLTFNLTINAYIKP